MGATGRPTTVHAFGHPGPVAELVTKVHALILRSHLKPGRKLRNTNPDNNDNPDTGDNSETSNAAHGSLAYEWGYAQPAV
jgi:hypothetical protein